MDYSKEIPTTRLAIIMNSNNNKFKLVKFDDKADEQNIAIAEKMIYARKLVHGLQLKYDQNGENISLNI